MATTEGFDVDRRVAIALDALTPRQRQLVEDAIRDKEHFLARAADGKHVERLAAGKPFRALRVGAGLRLIYRQTGDTIEVLDLMRKATLDRFATKRSRPAKGSNGKAAESGTMTRPA